MKSLTAAPDDAYDALDALDSETRFELEPDGTAGRVRIVLATAPRQPAVQAAGRTLRPPPPARSRPRGPLHVAATNLADVAGYCLEGGTPGGVWSSVARHTPTIVNAQKKRIYFGASRGYRIRRGDGQEAAGARAGATTVGATQSPLEVDPHPSFVFIRAVVDVCCLQAIERDLADRAAGADLESEGQAAHEPQHGDARGNEDNRRTQVMYADDLDLDDDRPPLVPRKRTVQLIR